MACKGGKKGTKGGNGGNLCDNSCNTNIPIP
jgi:hypothetical protein